MKELIEEATQLTTNLCKHFEGLSLNAYICPAGVPTIGYGSTHHLSGEKVKIGDAAITESMANLYLATEIKGFMQATLRLCPVLVNHEPHRLAAITDFAFNCGSGRLKSSTLRRTVNSEDWQESSVQLQRWIWGGGRKLPGLIRRRRAESNLLLGITLDKYRGS